jgi:MerR family transcriptional regulator, redox-sensitive transcriptional activator SoxR
VIDVAQRAGLSLDEVRELLDHGNDPVSDRLRALAARRLPEIDALIDRAQRVRSWLNDAAGCGCQSIDECGLFDDAIGLPESKDARRLTVVHVGDRA